MYAEMEFSVKSKTFHTMHKKTCAEWSLYKMKRTKTNKLKKQTSETFRLSAILAISGIGRSAGSRCCRGTTGFYTRESRTWRPPAGA